MARVIHTRLDAQSERLLARLRRQTALSDSEIVRRGLRALAGRSARSREIVGLGRFRSDANDLGSNKDHLQGFGRR